MRGKYLLGNNFFIIEASLVLGIVDIASLNNSRLEFLFTLAWVDEYFRNLNHRIKNITPIASTALTIIDNKKFFIKNCIHAKIIKKVATDMNTVSTIFENLNFIIISLLTTIADFKPIGARRATRMCRRAPNGAKNLLGFASRALKVG